MQMLLVLVALGLPVALLLAWVFDLTPQGLVRDEDVTPSAAASSSRLLSGVTIVLLVLALGYFIWESRWSGRDVEPAPPVSSDQEASAEETGIGDSIAVLPFENFSGSKEDEFFADGLTDTLLHKLAQIDQLTVIARNSTFQFKGQNRDIREIGQILGVDIVLEGSVQRAGEQVRIIAQLIRASDGAHLWSQSFDDTMDNIFALQDRVTTDIVKQLQVDLTAEQRRRMLRNGTDNPEAYELLIRAMNEETDHDDMGDVDDATWPPIVLIRQAIELDPDYSQAWARLSQEYNYLAFATRNSEKYPRFVAEALNAAGKALELDPELAHGHVAMGWATHRQGERLIAGQHFRRALKIDTNNVGALSGLALQVAASNPEEALRHLNRAIELDPTSVILHRQKHFALSRLGRYDEAIKELRLAIEKDPDAGLIYNDLSDLLVRRKGRADEAAVLNSRLVRQSPQSYQGLTAMLDSWIWAGGLEEAEAWAGLLLQIHPKSEGALRRDADRLIAAGRFIEALEVLDRLDENDDNRRGIVSTRIRACLAVKRTECVMQQSRVYSEELAKARTKGRGQLDWDVSSKLIEILGAEIENPATDMSKTLTEVSAVIEEKDYFRMKYLLQAGIAARLGRADHAIAILEQSLEDAEPGIFSLDILGFTAEYSMLLDPLRDLPEFEDWLMRHKLQRDALLQNMRQLESRGEIISVASVERLASG